MSQIAYYVPAGAVTEGDTIRCADEQDYVVTNVTWINDDLIRLDMADGSSDTWKPLAMVGHVVCARSYYGE